MKNIRSKVTSILLLILLLLIIQWQFPTLREIFSLSTTVVAPISEEKPEVLVSISGTELSENATTTVYVTDLRPQISIALPKGFTEADTQMFINDVGNVLGDDFYGVTRKVRGQLIFDPGFVIKPYVTVVLIETRNKEGLGLRQKYVVKVVYKEEFTTPIYASKVWFVHESTPHSWVKVLSEKLQIIPNTEDRHVSLFFLYPFVGDASVDFELTPIGTNTSIVPYFWDTIKNEFAIGSNGDSKTVLFHRIPNGTTEIDGNDVQLEPQHRYHIRILREQYHYTLSLRELDSSDYVDPELDSSSFETFLTYDDQDKRDLPWSDPDQFGISVWQNSHGVLVDDLYITGEI